MLAGSPLRRSSRERKVAEGSTCASSTITRVGGVSPSVDVAVRSMRRLRSRGEKLSLPWIHTGSCASEDDLTRTQPLTPRVLPAPPGATNSVTGPRVARSSCSQRRGLGM